MAFTCDQSTPATGSVAMWTFIARLKTAGWTQMGSGDGSTFSNAAAGPVANGGTGATGLGNTTAWVRLAQPGTLVGGSSTRELLFQRNSSDTSWAIKYSYAATFTGGSPSATVAPTATDSQTIINTTLFAANASYRLVVGADNAAPFSAYLGAWASGGGAAHTQILIEGMVSGSYPATDKDPYIFCAQQNATYAWNGGGGFWNRAGGANSPYGWLAVTGATTAGGTWQPLPGLVYRDDTGTLSPLALGTHSCSGNQSPLPVPFGRASSATAPTGWKGFGSALAFNSGVYATGDTLTVSTTRDRLCLRDFNVPWDGSVVTL